MAQPRVASDDFRGARGSNTGDDFHELWATRHAIRLLLREGGLSAIALEGLAAADESGEAKGSWDGVDCTLYHGGVDARAASVTIEQLKDSAANPQTPWTVARLVSGPRRNASVVAKLAKAHAALSKQRSGQLPAGVVLVTNQPVDPAVIAAVARAAGSPLRVPRTKPSGGADDELKLAYAADLTAVEFQSFAAALRFEGGVGSRFLLEERVLKAISEWTDLELQQTVATLRQYIRNCMRPEAAGQLITREAVMLRFGASEEHALFPCPSEISLAPNPGPRKQAKDAAELIRGSGRHVCLHGHGGVGKTTALQEIEATLPPGSVMIKYDCYGGGRYLDAGAFRHRTADAFVQLTNEMASSLRLPLHIGRNPGTDYPRAFSLRLRRAANAIAAANPGALLVVTVDAADNAITAALTRTPPESSFVQDFVGLAGQEENVRFVVTARTGRLPELNLPSHYKKVEIGPFALEETALNVARVWNAPRAWIEDFHHLSGGNPRVQAYAFQGNDDEPSSAIDHLRPNGKSLDEVFRQQFETAIQKGGAIGEITRLCAGLVILPRPVPLLDLSEVLGISQAKLTDICADLAPGIRLQSNVVSFADEDFEQFVRAEGQHALDDVHQRAADWLLYRMHADPYAALHVASVLIAADRRRELLDLVETEPAPHAVTDPVLRRVAEYSDFGWLFGCVAKRWTQGEHCGSCLSAQRVSGRTERFANSC